jgi:stringent starvation protein B
LALLERSTVFVHLDPRRDHVSVPPWFRKQPQLVLQLGYNMPVPIHDLYLDDECVSATLSFNRSPHSCRLPWSAVYALVGEDGRGMVWPDDVPAEVAAQVQVKEAQQPRGGHLRAVENEPAPVAAGARKRRRPKAAEPSPRAPREAPPREASPKRKVGTPADAPRNGGEPAAAQAPAKRQLPPYLRIVK